MSWPDVDNKHPVDALMGRNGDPLLATGTRSMWVELFERELERLVGERMLHPTGRHPEGGCGCAGESDDAPCVYHQRSAAGRKEGGMSDDKIEQARAAENELKRFREREPLVERLLSAAKDAALCMGGDGFKHTVQDVHDAIAAVSDFSLSVKCPSQDDGSADDLAPGTLAAVAESHGKTPSGAG